MTRLARFFGIIVLTIGTGTIPVLAEPNTPSGLLPKGLAIPPNQEVTVSPEPYEPARHGPLLPNTRPLANAARTPSAQLPQRPRVPQARGSVSAGQALPQSEPGSGDRGFYFAIESNSGIMVRNDAQTDLVIPPAAIGTTIYAPTHMAAGNTCIETTTAHWYYPGMTGTAHGHGFWDWCAGDGSGGWQVFEFMDADWTSKYVRQQGGEGRYWTQVFRNGGCWIGSLYNFQQGQWEEKTTICGVGPFRHGWTMWESHHLMDQARVCPTFPGIMAANIRVQTASGWTRPADGDVSQLGPYGLCWTNETYQFRARPNLDDWWTLTPDR